MDHPTCPEPAMFRGSPRNWTARTMIVNCSYDSKQTSPAKTKENALSSESLEICVCPSPGEGFCCYCKFVFVSAAEFELMFTTPSCWLRWCSRYFSSRFLWIFIELLFFVAQISWRSIPAQDWWIYFFITAPARSEWNIVLFIEFNW